MADIADRGSEIEEQARQRAIDLALSKRAEVPLLDPLDRRICKDCEALIPLKRLLANPFAVRCVPCQETLESAA